nr:zinc finger, CCHC-type [Tanacetum cinerariifolium]
MAGDASNFKHTLKHLKKELTLIDLGSHLRIEESLRVQDSNKPKGNNVTGPSVVNMMEQNNSSRYNDNKGKRKHHDTRANPNKKPKVTCWKCRKLGHLKRIARLVMFATKPMDQAQKDQRMVLSTLCKVRAPKQWHQKFDEVILSNGYLLNQDNKCVYSKFDASGEGVIICLYVDDMLIFGADQVHAYLTKEFLSSRFSMKDMGDADVILGIKIKHESNGITISQAHYIEKVLKIFNYPDCTPDVLETYCKEDEVADFLMVSFFEKVLSRSMNKEEPPIANGVVILGLRHFDVASSVRSPTHHHPSPLPSPFILATSSTSTAKGEKVSTQARVAYFKRSFQMRRATTPFTEDHTEIFEPDTRPHPAGKTRPAKKTKSKTTGSSEGSATGSISDFVSEDIRRKLQPGTSAYEAKKQKELTTTEFLTIDADQLPKPKTIIIRRRQEIIIAKYAQH